LANHAKLCRSGKEFFKKAGFKQKKRRSKNFGPTLLGFAMNFYFGI
jgi:hypothetical protein